MKPRNIAWLSSFFYCSSLLVYFLLGIYTFNRDNSFTVASSVIDKLLSLTVFVLFSRIYISKRSQNTELIMVSYQKFFNSRLFTILYLFILALLTISSIDKISAFIYVGESRDYIVNNFSGNYISFIINQLSSLMWPSSLSLRLIK